MPVGRGDGVKSVGVRGQKKYIASSRFHEQCSLEDLELKCLEIHKCIATRIQYHISLI